MPPIKKNFYIEDPAVTNMSSKKVADIRLNNNNIEVRYLFEKESSEELKIPNPVETFEQAFQVMYKILAYYCFNIETDNILVFMITALSGYS